MRGTIWLVVLSVAFLSTRSTKLFAKSTDTSVALAVGAARRLQSAGGSEKWSSSDASVAEVYQNGFVIGVKPGEATVHAPDETAFTVTVKVVEQPLINPSTLKQYNNVRRFEVNGRKCYGSELNGQRASDPEERQFVSSNRVINPRPLASGKEEQLEWEVQEGTEVYDGAGVLMGTVAPGKIGDKKVPTSKFNFGMSKVLNGKLCLYAFSITIQASPEVAKILDVSESKSGRVGTSAWLPLDRVVDKETLLERIGVGKVKLPRLPLASKGFKITGGDPKQYMTPDHGELKITKDIDGAPVPSHYLRRPSGTVNILYSVPGFGLGGQGLDSFLITDGIVFYPAKGARTFTQPTYLPAGHPHAGKTAAKTMTFIYGAAEVKGVEPVYGWVAREALGK
jgi:hypothetical protein